MVADSEGALSISNSGNVPKLIVVLLGRVICLVSVSVQDLGNSFSTDLTSLDSAAAGQVMWGWGGGFLGFGR